MDINSVVTLISSVGFPIVACGAMAWFYANTFQKFTDLVTKNNILTEELIAILNKTESGENENNK